MTVPRLQMDEANQAIGPYHDGTHKILDRILYNRQQGFYARPSGSVVDVVNMPGSTITVAGTPSNADDSLGPWVRWTSATTIDADAGAFATTASACARGSWAVEARALIKLGATLTSTRHWVGMFSATPMASADPAVSAAGFRYDTVADGTAFWRCYSNNGTTTGLVTALTAGIQAGVGAVVASRSYDLRIKIEALGGNAPNKVMFFVNDLLVAMHASELPATATYLAPRAQVRHLVAGGTAATIDVNQFVFNSQPIS